MAFEAIRNVVDNIKRIDPSKIVIKQMSTPASKKLIIQLNTIGQLFQKGEDSRGIRLDSIGGGYSIVTEQIKRASNQPIDRVTLHDTGAFYGSWKVTAEGNNIIITADPTKDQDNLFDRWGEDVVGLQDESLLLLIESIIDEFVEETKIEILRG